VEKGELVKVLPDWSLPEVTGWAVFLGRRLMPAKTRAFLDMMEEMCCEEARNRHRLGNLPDSEN
jgi:DNA-binding transcriptional LysR family regulator